MRKVGFDAGKYQPQASGSSGRNVFWLRRLGDSIYPRWLPLLCVIPGLLVAAASCRVRQGASLASDSSNSNQSLQRSAPSDLTSDQRKAFTLLVNHCKACHAVGEYRFLQPQDARATWVQLFNEKSPKSDAVWAERIIKSLSWPDGLLPAESARNSPEFRYMPIGIQRAKIHGVTVDGQSAREFLIEILKADLKTTSAVD